MATTQRQFGFVRGRIEQLTDSTNESIALRRRIHDLEMQNMRLIYRREIELWRLRFIGAILCLVGVLILWWNLSGARAAFDAWAVNAAMTSIRTSALVIQHTLGCDFLPRILSPNCDQPAAAGIPQSIPAQPALQSPAQAQLVQNVYINVAPKAFADMTIYDTLEDLQFQYWGNQTFKDERDGTFYIIMNKKNMSFINQDGVEGGVTGRWYRVSNVVYTPEGYVQSITFTSLGKW